MTDAVQSQLVHTELCRTFGAKDDDGGVAAHNAQVSEIIASLGDSRSGRRAVVEAIAKVRASMTRRRLRNCAMVLQTLHFEFHMPCESPCAR